MKHSNRNRVKKKIKYNGNGVKYLGTDGELNTFMDSHLSFKRQKKRKLRKAISKLRRSRIMDYEV